MGKVYLDAKTALSDVLFDGITIMSGGFGLCGIPEHCIRAIAAAGTKNITWIANNCGTDDFGSGILLHSRQIRKMIASYVGENKTFEKQFLSGELEVEFNPQGTLAERIRAAGAGIPAFFTATGYGTVIANGKETRQFGDQHYVMETALHADLAIVKAWKGDTEGNLVYRKTTRNFNLPMAMAGKITIAELEELVEPWQLDPDMIHTPSIFVQRIFKGEHFEKRIEFTTTREK
jgi:3-oxoacid CoA-transferase subunit A